MFWADLAKAGSPLIISVSEFHGANSIRLNFYKFVRDAYSDSTYGAITWQQGGVGYYRGNWREFVDFVRVRTGRRLDLFIDRYCQVSQAVCEPR